ncbi:MAG TPA: ABC transporter ATP-binding protein [Spirillospora sp.]|nr:ABC transporter ATP-binding protein [Spirillospora sp.]
MSVDEQPFIACKRIVKAYRVAKHEIVALRGIDFEMAKGEMVAIIGPSGAGKSSLLNLLGGLDKPTAGQLVVAGQDLLELRGRRLADYRLRQVGFVWQQIERNLFFHRSALRNVTLPMMLAGINWRERRRRAEELLHAVGLADHMHKSPAALSGGQQQRVAVAVALANNPPLLLLDEPTGALDRQSAGQVMALVQELRRRYNLTVLMVTHDLEVAAYADRILTLRDGALGQDIRHPEEETPRLDDSGRIRLPDAVRSQLAEAPRIAIEIRPEGVLLRPEVEAVDDTDALLQDILPQDAPPEKRRWRLFGWRRRQPEAGP